MGLSIFLLGKPRVERDGASLPPPRGRKTWALLAYLLLSETPPPRSRVAESLFSEAEDPLGTLRWTLSDLRRALAGGEVVGGDPLTLQLTEETEVDVLALTSPGDGVAAPVRPGELLEGMSFPSSPAFESWLGVTRRHLEGAARAMAHDEALACLAADEVDRACELAAELVTQDPLDHAGQELLIRSLARAGRQQAAQQQLEECTALFQRELGTSPGPELKRAAGEAEAVASGAVGDRDAAVGQLEAGQAALDSGSVEPGVEILRQACAEARASGDPKLEARALTALGTALVHAVRGYDEEGAARLHEALRLAEEHDERATAAAASRELGYIDVQAGRVPSAGRWLMRATELAEGNEELCAVLGFRGMALSDRARYQAGLELLTKSVARAERCGARRQAAWSLTLIARVHVLRGDVALALPPLEEALALVAAERWTAFQPLPEVLRGEASLLMGKPEEAGERLDHAFRLACSLGDPCWEAMGGRVKGRLAAAAGDTAKAREHFADALVRATRVSDAYQWAYASVLDSAAELAAGTAADDARAKVEALAELAQRCGFREYVVRAHVYRSRLGTAGSLDSSRLLAGEIDNPALAELTQPAVAA